MAIRPPRPNLYHPHFLTALNGLSAGQKMWLDALIALPQLPSTSRSTKIGHLKELVEQQPALLLKIDGLFPSADTIIQLVEQQHGAITEQLLPQANLHAAQIVMGVAAPITGQVVSAALQPFIQGNQISIPMPDLLSFLVDEFTDFIKSSGSGLISIAGTLNEALLMKAMNNGGMRQGTDFEKTGTNSKADLIVHSHVATRPQLGVEIKSYHARERLLRGLQDITGDKVGVGFFKNANEFNVSRTQTLLNTGAAAVYMPQATLSNVSATAKTMMTARQVPFYRPIERFVSDMKHFVGHGVLP